MYYIPYFCMFSKLPKLQFTSHQPKENVQFVFFSGSNKSLKKLSSNIFLPYNYG